jgi:hypothetical protein
MTTTNSNVNDKLKESFEAGGEAKEKLKHTAEQAKHASYVVFGIVVFLWVVFLFIPSFDSSDPENRISMSPSRPGHVVTQTAPAVIQNSASGVVTWDRLEADGSVPVGMWSHELHGKVGCSVKVIHDTGMYRQYRFITTEWKDYVPGTSPDFSAIRFMAKEPGRRQPIYTFTCS